MSSFTRYPLPSIVAIICIIVGLMVPFVEWVNPETEESSGLNILVGVFLGLVIGVGIAVALWHWCRLLCQWVMVLIPRCWNEHAWEAGLVSEVEQLRSGISKKIPLGVCKIRAQPKIKHRSLWIPVKTTSKAMTRANASAMADNLARVMQLSCAEVKWPNKNTNSGYCWFIISEKDETEC